MKKFLFVLMLPMLFLAGAYMAKAVAPATPANLTVVNGSVTTTSVGLTWDGVSGVAGYDIYRNGTSTVYATTTGTGFTDSGLAPLTTYTYYVDAFDASNTKSVVSASVATTTLADTAAPSQPLSFGASIFSPTQINLSWASSTDNVGVVGYKVFRNSVQVGTTSAINFSDTGLTAGTPYTYYVEAYDAAGNISINSGSVNISTPATDTIAPSIPANLTATAISSSQINLAWSASTDNVLTTGYYVYRSDVVAPIATVNTNSYSNTGLTASTTYSYSVAAFDGSNNVSARSATATATTLVGTTPSTGNATIAFFNHRSGQVFNFRSNEVVKIIVYSNGNFLARDIDNKTVLFGGAKPIGWMLMNMNRDRKLDRIYSFRVRDIKNLVNGNNTVTFTASTKGGTQSIQATIDMKVKNAPKIVKPVKKEVKIENKIKTTIQNIQKKIDDIKVNTEKKINQLQVKMNNTVIKQTIKSEKKEIKQENKSVKNGSKSNNGKNK